MNEEKKIKRVNNRFLVGYCKMLVDIFLVTYINRNDFFASASIQVQGGWAHYDQWKCKRSLCKNYNMEKNILIGCKNKRILNYCIVILNIL